MASLGAAAGSQLSEPSTFDPIPAGVYDAEVTASDVVRTKSNTGLMLKLQIRINGPECEGRVLFDQINIENQSQQAQEIGQRQLSDLSRACGFSANPVESTEFHGIPIRVRVRIDPEKNGYPAKNIVGAYLEPSNSAPPQQRPALVASRQAPTPTSRPAGTRPPPAFMARRNEIGR